MDSNKQQKLNEDLLEASRISTDEEVISLLSAGADVNTVSLTGMTPLGWAAFRGNKKLVDIFLEQGAKINGAGDKYNTPLMWATFNTQPEVISHLMLKGADVNTQNEVGNSALHFAVMDRSYASVCVLIKKETLNLRNKAGKTPLELSLEYGCDNITTKILFCISEKDFRDLQNIPTYNARLKEYRKRLTGEIVDLPASGYLPSFDYKPPVQEDFFEVIQEAASYVPKKRQFLGI